jgi:hypothetical protein
VLTVLLATHNGEHVLGRVLDAYTRLSEPKGGWKLIVVNNASSDTTSQILESFKDRLPLTICLEARRGKNIALNSGLELIEGDVVVLTDDDAIPPPDWLMKWREIADKNPDVSVFGGKIMPYWESPPPDWVLQSVPLGVAFVVTPDDLAAGDVNPGMIWGPNMMVRAQIFAAGSRFNEQIGPAAGNYIMGSETEFNRRVAAMGHKCQYFPEVTVQHIIRSHQFNPEWLLGRAFRHGKQNGKLAKAKKRRNVSFIAGYPRWMLAEFLMNFWRLGWARLVDNPAVAFKARWRISEIRGFFSEFK